MGCVKLYKVCGCVYCIIFGDCCYKKEELLILFLFFKLYWFVIVLIYVLVYVVKGIMMRIIFFFYIVFWIRDINISLGVIYWLFLVYKFSF